MMKASNHSYKIPNDPKSGYGGCCIIAIAFLSAIIFLCSCKVTKYVDRVEVKSDSTAIKDRDSLIRKQYEDSVNYAMVVELLSQGSVTFDCPPCDSTTPGTKVEIKPDGTIKAEGRIKSVNTKVQAKETIDINWKAKYDSLSQVKSKDVTQVSETKKETTKEKKSGFPWFWLVVGLIAGFAIHNLLLAGLDWIDKRIKL